MGTKDHSMWITSLSVNGFYILHLVSGLFLVDGPFLVDGSFWSLVISRWSMCPHNIG